MADLEDDEAEVAPADLQKMETKDLLLLAVEYIEIGIDWNFDRAQVGKGWLDGHVLRDVLVQRAKEIGMPTPHDSKPRNKSRREKYQRETGHKFSLNSRRTIARGLLRANYLAAVKAQRELETALRNLGIKWRAAEKAVGKLADGKWRGFDEKILKQLVEDTGTKIAA